MSNKYGARKAAFDGYVFDSQAEGRRYRELCLLVAAGEIADLQVHPVFELQPKFRRDGKVERAVTYEGDFQYIEAGRKICEDVKGVRTAVFNLKRRLFLFKFPDIELRVVQ